MKQTMLIRKLVKMLKMKPLPSTSYRKNGKINNSKADSIT